MFIDGRSNLLRPSLISYQKQSAKEFPNYPVAKKNSTAQPLYITMPSSAAIFPNSSPITNQATGQGETDLEIFYGLIHPVAKT